MVVNSIKVAKLKPEIGRLPPCKSLDAHLKAFFSQIPRTPRGIFIRRSANRSPGRPVRILKRVLLCKALIF